MTTPPEPLRPAPTGAVLLANAFTGSGFLIYALPPALPHIWFHPVLFGERLALISTCGVLLALGAATLAVPYIGTRRVYLALVVGWSAVGLFVALAEPLSILRPGSEMMLMACVPMVVVPATVMLSAAALARLRGERRTNPTFLFAFFFLGAALSVVALPLCFESDTPVISIVVGLLILTAILFAGAFVSIELSDAVAIPTRSPAPTWLRRLRWTLLGGLPVCVVLGLMTYVSTDLSPIPLFWIVPTTLYQISWVVAFARMTTDGPNWLASSVQMFGFLSLAPILWLAREVGVRGDDLMLLTVCLVAMALPLLLPHRFTLMAQSSLLAIVLMQIFVKLPFDANGSGMILIILLNILECVLVCWGCHGDAVKDAPEVDRLPEFMAFTQGGAIVCGIAFTLLPALLFPTWVIEYPLVLGACVVLRSLPWPWPRARGSSSHAAAESPARP